MGDETTVSNLSELEAQALAELEEEYQRELERNAAALRLLKARFEEAEIAKSRQQLSQEKMECMKVKFSHVHNKLEYAKENLRTAQDRMDRSNQLHATVQDLKVKAAELGIQTSRITDQRQALSQAVLPNSESDYQAATNPLGLLDCPDFDFPAPLIDYAAEEEEEKKKQLAKSDEPDNQPRIQIPGTLKRTTPPKHQSPPKIDYARTVQDLQEKLSRVNSGDGSRKSSSASSASSVSSVAAFTNDSIATPVPDERKTTTKDELKAAEIAPKIAIKEDHETEDALAIFTESVQRTEARCAGIHEELGRMALSEQYMRTKQAQLRAKKKEMEAKEAMEKAEVREREAAEMRRKVGEMMKLLSDRKNKLKTTETTIEKKGKVVDNVNKILNRKHRREDFVEKEKMDKMLFGKKK